LVLWRELRRRPSKGYTMCRVSDILDSDEIDEETSNKLKGNC